MCRLSPAGSHAGSSFRPATLLAMNAMPKFSGKAPGSGPEIWAATLRAGAAIAACRPTPSDREGSCCKQLPSVTPDMAFTMASGMSMALAHAPFTYVLEPSLRGVGTYSTCIVDSYSFVTVGSNGEIMQGVTVSSRGCLRAFTASTSTRRARTS